MTIHGSKSELELLRYHENRDNAPIDAPLTSESHNFRSDRWNSRSIPFSKLKVKTFPDQTHLRKFEGGGPSPHNLCQGNKRPQAPLKKKKKRSPWLLCFTWMFSTHFSCLSHTHTHIKVSWFFLLHQKYKVLFLYPIFFSLVLHLDLGFRGVDETF